MTVVRSQHDQRVAFVVGEVRDLPGGEGGLEEEKIAGAGTGEEPGGKGQGGGG